MNGDESGSLYNRDTMRNYGLLLLLVSVQVGTAIAKLMTIGWFGLLFSPLYVLMWALHGGIHFRITHTFKGDHAPLALILLSHVAYVGAFLFQWDWTDAGPAWLTITRLLGMAGTVAWWPFPVGDGPFLWANMLVFIPVICSWLLLWHT
jgi:hypothetical protein